MSQEMNGNTYQLHFQLGQQATHIEYLRERLERLERAKEKSTHAFPWNKLLPALWGLVILGLAAIGKISWPMAMALIGSG